MNPASAFIRTDTDRDRDLDAFLQRLVAAGVGGRLPGLPAYLAQLLARLDGQTLRLLDERLTHRLLSAVAASWEKGWQPADLQHVAARPDRRVGELASAVISEQGRRSRAATRAPREWLDQLDEAGSAAVEAGLGPCADRRWSVVARQLATGRTPADAWAEAVVLAGCVEWLPRLPPLTPPPSTWSNATPFRPAADQPRPRGADQERVLRKIRGLLAKAEATEYAAEAEVFTAKAQDLMSRHAIDATLVAAGTDAQVAVGGRRVHLVSPYLLEKASLLGAVARANRAKVVTFEKLGLAMVVGTPVDVEQIDTLFTSLLVQATRAMTEAGRGRPGSRSRTSSFRRSFLMAYASRISERLTAADESVRASYGTDLVPVLARVSRAVDEEFERLFPHVRTRSSASYHLDGWDAGRQAADRAVLPAGRVTAGPT